MRQTAITSHLAVVGLLIAVAAGSSPGARAAVTTFTSRAAWEAAVTGEVTDGFDLAPDGVQPTPYALAGGLLLTSLSSTPVDIQVLDPGLLGSRELHFRDFTSGVELALAGNGNAFGFDYQASEDWVLSANGQSVTLHPSTAGFIGFIDDAAAISSFSLRGAAGAQGGISVDNLSRIGTSFAGLHHRPLGAAKVTQLGNGRLSVSNIGSGGEDGVAISVGEVESFTTELLLMPDATPVGAIMESRLRGVVNDLPDQPAGRIGLRKTPSGYNAIVDFTAIGSPTYTVRVYDRLGHVLFERSGVSGEAVSLSTSLIEIKLKCTTTTTTADGTTSTTTSTTTEWTLSVDVDWTILGRIFRGPRIAFAPDAPVGGGPQVEVTAVNMIASQMPEFQILGESIGLLGLDHRVIGASTFTPSLDSLRVSHFGSTGEDGVFVDLGHAEAVDFDITPFDQAGPVPAGALLRVGATGSVGGVPEHSLGDLMLTQTAVGLEVAADFSAIQAATQRIVLLDDGVAVTDVPNHTGIAAFASRWPIRLGKLGGPLECFVGGFPPDTTFVIDGHAFLGNELRVLAEAQGPAIDFKSGFSFQATGVPEFTLSNARVALTGCVPGPTALCLRDGRFKVETVWKTHDGTSGAGQAVPLTVDTGYFWFFGPSNVEMVLKVLDACPFNQRFWVFAGGLTNVEVTTTVTDTVSGAVKTYTNPQGTPFQPLLDTDAFATCSAAAAGPEAAVDTLSSARALSNAAKDGTALLLNDERFRVEVQWQTTDGQTGAGQAVPLTNDTGYFWFFADSNVEVVIKVLTACGFNNRYWVFAGGLTDVKTRIVVTDTLRGVVKEYNTPLGVPFQPILDTNAFATCP